MKLIRNDSHDPYYNLALEEYILKELDIDANGYFILWQNKPTVVVGKFQNTIAEINADYVKEHQINVVRRLSGGGAVYHDLGNLNFTFIVKNDTGEINFQQFTSPIVKVLRSLGVPAEHSGRNDITVEGKKISGNSQYHYRGRLLHHGTILFKSDLAKVCSALSVAEDKFQSKAVKSIRARVANVTDFLQNELTIYQFKELLISSLFSGNNVCEYQLTPWDKEKVEELMTQKYLTWEWNYSKSPTFNVRKKERFSWGGVETLLRIEDGVICEGTIFGDFFSSSHIDDFTEMLVGVKYEESALRGLLERVNLKNYFGTSSQEDVLKCLL